MRKEGQRQIAACVLMLVCSVIKQSWTATNSSHISAEFGCLTESCRNVGESMRRQSEPIVPEGFVNP